MSSGREVTRQEAIEREDTCHQVKAEVETETRQMILDREDGGQYQMGAVEETATPEGPERSQT